MAAISTLYFIEHSKQSERNFYRNLEFNEFRPFGRNLIGNSTPNNSVGGVGVSNSNEMNYWNDNIRFNSRKVDYAAYQDRYMSSQSKSIQYNTQNSTNLNLRQQQLLTGSLIVTTTIPSIPSMSNIDLKPNFASTSKTTSLQLTTDDLERPFEYEQNASNDTNENIIIKQMKTPKLSNDDTATEKQLTKFDKFDIYPIVSEPHDLNNSIAEHTYLLTDVDTNFIDVGQQIVRNNTSKYFSYDQIATYIVFFRVSNNEIISFHIEIYTRLMNHGDGTMKTYINF